MPAQKPARRPAPKTPRPAKSAAQSRPAAVEIKVDRALKKRWEKVSEAVRDAQREGASAFDRLWEAAAEIVEHEPPLFLAGGFATAKAFFASVLKETERSAWRNVRVAKFASPAEEVRYGTSKLDAVLTWLEAKSGGAQKGRVPVDFDKVRIPVARGGKTTPLQIEDATVEEIAAATRALRRGGKSAPAKASPVVTAVSRELKSAALRGVSVRLAGGKLSLGEVPVEALPALAKALARVKLPDDNA